MKGFRTTKYVLLTFIGGQVRPVHKAKSNAHRFALYQWISPRLQLHGEMQLLQAEDLTLPNLLSKIKLT